MVNPAIEFLGYNSGLISINGHFGWVTPKIPSLETQTLFPFTSKNDPFSHWQAPSIKTRGYKHFILKDNGNRVFEPPPITMFPAKLSIKYVKVEYMDPRDYHYHKQTSHYHVGRSPVLH